MRFFSEMTRPEQTISYSPLGIDFQSRKNTGLPTGGGAL